MMYGISAAQAKRGKKHHSSREAPKHGTKIRSVYDDLRLGKNVDFYRFYSKANSISAAKIYLLDSYGMELRRVGRGTYVWCG